MNIENRKAFSMIELVFVIVIIGILASVAIPKLSASRDDAVVTKARTTVASVRNALSIERQKRILRGNFETIKAVGGDSEVFGYFDNNVSLSPVLEYPIKSEPNRKDRWYFKSKAGKDGRDQYIFNSNLGEVIFEIVNGKFECDIRLTSNTNDVGCNQLTR